MRKRERIKMKHPNYKGACYADYPEHAERMISMFGYELDDDRYTQQGKQIKKKKKKKDTDDA